MKLLSFSQTVWPVSMLKVPIILFLLLFSNEIVAQNQTISFSKKQLTLSVAFEEIKTQTQMTVAYNEKIIDVKQVVSTDISGTLEKVMSHILANTGTTYKIVGKQIVIIQSQQAKKESVDKKVSGVVADANGPVIGATVMVKGATTRGTTTDAKGQFTLANVEDGAVINISFVGYDPIEVVYNGQTMLNVKLQEASNELEQVVVTALGIKREQKALSYNVQQINQDDITTVKDANFMNSLAGKVAGVNINQSSSGVGGATKVVMRGVKSIEQSSNALYVIDGIPMFNFGGGGGTEFDSRGASESIADLNPEDIETVSILTGAAAAALYGSNAANGAIVITTKRGEAGKLKVSLSSNTSFLDPFVMPRFQNRYGTGSDGKLGGSTIQSWGSLLNRSSQRGYTPEDFFETGTIYTNSVTLSGGSDKNQTFLSASSVNSEGIVPNNKYNRYNFTFRNTSAFLNDKLKIDIGGSYIIQNDQNMTNQGVYSNPLVPAYLYPRGDDFSLTQAFERYDPVRDIMVQYWPQGEGGDLRIQNPYWIAYRNLRNNDKKRYMFSASVNYEILDWMNIIGRVRVDNANNMYTQKLYASSNTTLTEGSSQGHFTQEKNNESQTYADVLVNINKQIGKDISLVANIGASISNNDVDEFSHRGPIRENGVPNAFNVFDLDNSKERARQGGWREQTQSVLASVELGWKRMLYLTLTGRNDWASQLANSPQSSFFYPSVGLSGVISEITKMPEAITYLKVRGSFSSVGTPYPRHLTSPTYSYNETTQSWRPKTHYPIGKLYPERTNSWEVGFDIRFLKNFSLSASFYTADTENQTFDPKISVSSGYSTIYLQTGHVRNTGVEASLGYKNTWNRFTWDSGVTFSWNKNKIIDLVTNYLHPETLELITKDRLDIKGLGKTTFLLKTGGTLGDLYTQSDLKRDASGMIEIDDAGNVVTVDNQADIKLGSVLPKYNLAWRNNFSWRGFNVGALVTARIGGIVYSATQAAMDLYGVSETSAMARDAGGVIINGGRNVVKPQSWYSVVGAQSGLPQYYTYSATNVRLQELSVGYTIPRSKLGDVCSITVSLVGRNLWMIYNKAPFDPESLAYTGNYYQGIDYFMMPSTRNLGFDVKINF